MPLLQLISELDSRESGGVEVSLLWNRRTGALRVCVSNRLSGAYFELDAAPHEALDVFRHPFSYAALRGVAYDATPVAA